MAEHTDAYTANRAFAVGVEHHLHRTDFTDTIYQKSFIFFLGGGTNILWHAAITAYTNLRTMASNSGGIHDPLAAGSAATARRLH